MSGSRKTSSNIVSSEFYKLVSDVKDENVNSDDKREIAFGGPLEEPEQHERDSNSELEIDEVNQDTLYIEIPSPDDEINIKYEGQDWALNGGGDLDLEGELPEMNPKPEQLTVNQDLEQIELNRLCLDLLQCERDCGTCQKYIRKLRDHVSSTHATTQPTSDPLHIDPDLLEMGQSSFIEINCEQDEVIENMDCSEETESEPDFDGECGSDGDPDYSTSPYLTRNILRLKVVKEKGPTELEWPNEGTSKLRGSVQARDKQFTCKTCGEGFLTKNKLTKHEWSHTGEVLNTCETCGDGFVRKYRLVQHERTHNGEKTPRISRRTIHNISTHKSHTGDSNSEFELSSEVETVSDSDSDSAYNTSRDLNRKRKSGQKSVRCVFKCGVCLKDFASKSNLTAHMRRHTGDKPFKCDSCLKCFSKKYDLIMHKKGHTGNKPFKCEDCAKSFAQKSHLDDHRRSHTQEKPFQCALCLKCFSIKCNLVMHMRCHTGDKPFRCDVCNKSFSQKVHLDSHIRSHTGVKPFKCDLCTKCFTEK